MTNRDSNWNLDKIWSYHVELVQYYWWKCSYLQTRCNPVILNVLNASTNVLVFCKQSFHWYLSVFLWNHPSVTATDQLPQVAHETSDYYTERTYLSRVVPWPLLLKTFLVHHLYSFHHSRSAGPNISSLIISFWIPLDSRCFSSNQWLFSSK